MIRSVAAFALLLLAPSLGLAYFALRVADQDFAAAVSAIDAELEIEADALATRVSSALAAADREFERIRARTQRSVAEGEPVRVAPLVGFVRDAAARTLTFDLRPEARLQRAGDDEYLYRLCVRGGEYFEHVLDAPARALDAYAFYLARIRDRELGDRLRLASARAARATGRDRLARGILTSILNGTQATWSEDGKPLVFLAAFALLDLGPESDSSRPALPMSTADLGEILAREHGLASDRLLSLAARRLPASTLPDLLAARAELAGAARRCPHALVDEEAVLDGDGILAAFPVTSPDGGQHRALVRVPFEPPPLALARGYEARLEPSESETTHVDASVRRPVVFGAATVGRLLVSDPRRSLRVAGLHERRRILRLLIGLLVVTTLAGAGALVAFVRRERRLARLKSQLLANVSHELKTPATSIRLFSEMLSTDELDAATAQRYASLLHGESLRLSRTIENVLEFSRLERGITTVQLVRVDVGAALEKTAEMFAFRARESGVEFQFERERGDCVARADARALERIVLNLLENALKYRGEERPQIRLRVSRATPWIEVAIADNGVGIAPEDRKRVFDEFVRASFDDYSVQGTGLGLAIARRLSEQMGGELTLESTRGSGSTFTLRLPIAGVNGPRLLPAFPEGSENPAPPEDSHRSAGDAS